MAIAQSNPELVIDIKYDSAKSEQALSKEFRRTEALAKSHEDKLRDIYSRSNSDKLNISKTYYSSVEGELKKHVDKTTGIQGNQYSNGIKAQEKFHNVSLSAHKNHYSSLERLSVKQKNLLLQEIQANKMLLPLLNNYTSMLGGAVAVMNKDISNSGIGNLLLGGTAAKTFLSGNDITNRFFPKLSSVDLNNVRRDLGSVYGEFRETQKRLERDAFELKDEFAGRAADILSGQMADIRQSMVGLNAAHKDISKAITESNEGIDGHNRKLKESYEETDVLKGVAVAVGAVYSAWSIGKFLVDLSSASARTEQLRNTFEKIGGSDQLFEKLKKSTFGAVSNQKLLATANYGSFMGIDLQKIPDLLKFASIRAAETGQSIDYMVQSIVTGLGRKSPMILDNLGLKMSDMDAEILKLARSSGITVNKVGDLEKEFFLIEAATNVARESIKKTGVDMDNLSTKTEGLSAKWENLMDSLGSFVAPVSNYLTDETSKALDRWTLTFNNIKKLLGMEYDKPAMPQIDITPFVKNTLSHQKNYVQVDDQYRYRMAKAQEEKDKQTGSTAEKEKSLRERIIEEAKEHQKKNQELQQSIELYRQLAVEYIKNADAARYYIEKLNELRPVKALGADVIPMQKGSFTMSPVAVPENPANKIEPDMTEFYNKLQEQLQTYQTVLGEVSGFITSLFDAQSQALFNQLECLQEIINLENERWQNQSESLQEAGLESTAYYVKLRKDHEANIKQMNDKEKSLQADSWEQEKEARITSIIMSTAQAVMQAWATSPILAPFLSAVIAATSAVQLGSVASTQNPYRRNVGGWIPGNGFTDDKPALLTGGEFVVNRTAARENASALEAINSGQIAQNTKPGNIYITIEGNLVGNQQFIEDHLIPGIKTAIDKGYTI
jgi:hypothetical protein